MARGLTAVGQKGKTLVFTPVPGAGFTVDLDSAGATTANAATVDQFGLAVMEVDALVEERPA